MPHVLKLRLLGFLAPVLGFSLLFGLAPRASATTVDVDLQLVLAVDSSGSIDDDEFILQRWGYAHAFRNPRIIRAIRNGYHRAMPSPISNGRGPEYR